MGLSGQGEWSGLAPQSKMVAAFEHSARPFEPLGAQRFCRNAFHLSQFAIRHTAVFAFTQSRLGPER